MGVYVPDLIAGSLFEIPLAELTAAGITGLAFDLDNTIVEWNSMDVEQEVVAWFQDIQTQGFLPVIVSNNSSARIEPVAALLGIPFVARAQKPRAIGLLKAAELLGLTPERCALVGDQLMTDIRAGNRAGFFTVLVTPISAHEFWGTKVNRCFEKLLYRRMKRPHTFRK